MRITAAKPGEISDEASYGKARHAATFEPGLETVSRGLGALPVREISPYLLALGPFEGTTEWKNVLVLTDGPPFTARLLGKETVVVPAGTFEAWKIHIKGGQILVEQGPVLPYNVMVWYAPAAKRFVRLTFTAHVVAGGYFPADKDSIELTEFKVQ